MEKKKLLILVIYIAILVLHSTMFAIDNYITLKFYPKNTLEEISGKSIDTYNDDIINYTFGLIDNTPNLSSEQKEEAKKDIVNPIKEKIFDFFNEFYIKFDIGLLKICTSLSDNIENLNLQNDPVINRYNLDFSEIQNKMDNELKPLFKCYNYNSLNFNEIKTYMNHIRNLIISLFVAIIFIILVIFVKLIGKKKLKLFTLIKNIINVFIGFIFIIIFCLLFFLPGILNHMNISLKNSGIYDFEDTSILRTKNWGTSFSLLLVIIILLFFKKLFL